MSSQQENPQNKSEFIEVIRINDRGRTIRTALICVTVIICLGMVVAGILWWKDRPWWEFLVTAAIGLAVPSGLMWRMNFVYKESIKKNGERSKEVQASVDPMRSSCDVLDDDHKPNFE